MIVGAGGPGAGHEDLRRILGLFPTGVAIITTVAAAGPAGLVVNSFTSVSLDPPLVGFFPAHSSRTWPLIRAAGAFCVNILAADQEPLARVFAGSGEDRFRGVPWRAAPHTGSPVLDGVLGWIDCTLYDVVPTGDHDLALGRVRSADAADDGVFTEPLVFHRSRYHLTAGGEA
ncbi:flavin reductase family protein [Luedemannella flava]|uniref:Flavin reductase family protein n=1 Tax=Luedemannella flava TaxID=349316 RepID=A0ABP4XV75_9ACTN